MLYVLCLVKRKFQPEKDLVLTNQRTELIVITRSRITRSRIITRSIIITSSRIS